ncbi:MAG: hypothetical protein K8L97_33640 [Anaerolineae bacterium]|nr:hypothetical protein [Anaerolineae bacterium]
MPKPFEDILPLEGNYWCEVVRYLPIHSALTLRFTHESSFQEFFYVEFVEVKYHAGPIAWTNANFHIASTEECADILQHIAGFTKFSTVELKNRVINVNHGYKLYISGSEPIAVKIIATGAHIFSPDEYAF